MFGGKVLKSGQQSVESPPRTQASSLLRPVCERRLGIPAWSPFPFRPKIFLPPRFHAPYAGDPGHGDQRGPTSCSLLGVGR